MRIIHIKPRENKDLRIYAAVEYAVQIKLDTVSKRSQDMYHSYSRKFNQYILETSLSNLNILHFDSVAALKFMDYIAAQGVVNKTYNNYLIQSKAVFQELLKREIINKNPFTSIKEKKVQGKQRRSLTKSERHTIIKRVRNEDEFLNLAINLLFYCFIRPIELRRLRLRMFDFESGVICMPASITKNKKASIVTMPIQVLKLMKEMKLEEYAGHLFLFGARLRPHPSKQCGANTMNYRHNKFLRALFESGALGDIKGLSFYSWKDTGAIAMIKAGINIMELKKQLRHQDLATTQVYLESLYEINKNIQNLPELI